MSYRPDVEERPLGTRRVTPGSNGSPRRTAPPPRRHTLGRILALIALLVVAVVVWFLIALFEPFTGSGQGSVTVRIPAGSGASRIGDELDRSGVVDSSFFFSLRASLSGEKSKLRSGTFTLKRGMSYAAAIDALTRIPVKPKIALVNVTIPEGRSIREESPRIASAGLPGDYASAARSSSALNPSAYGAPAGTRTLEGFLFPATYALRAPGSARALVSAQLASFKARFKGISLSYARRKHLTPYDVLIVASMVEREAALTRERPLVAAVIYNRLHDHIPLGIDATTRYFLNDWTRPLLESQLKADNPYNTRLHAGLPPTPIGSPGLASIRAAANPGRAGYLYYVAKPGTCGHAFSNDNAHFQVDVARYNAARTQQGGRSPTKC